MECWLCKQFTCPVDRGRSLALLQAILDQWEVFHGVIERNSSLLHLKPGGKKEKSMIFTLKITKSLLRIGKMKGDDKNSLRKAQKVKWNMIIITSHLWRWCNTQVVGLCRWGLLGPPDRSPPCCWKWASPQQRAQGAGNAPPPGPVGHMMDPTSCWRTQAHLGWATSEKHKTSTLKTSGNWQKYFSCVLVHVCYLPCGQRVWRWYFQTTSP